MNPPRWNSGNIDVGVGNSVDLGMGEDKDACVDRCGDSKPGFEADLGTIVDGSVGVSMDGSVDGWIVDPVDARAQPPVDARIPDPADAAVEARDDARPPELRDAGLLACPVEALSAELAESRMFLRDESVRIDYALAPGHELVVATPLGGRIVMRDDHLFYSAGGGEDGDLGWPHWTSEVPVVLTATDPQGTCESRVEIPLTIAGDVINGDFETGRILVFGNDGRYLGTFAPLSGRRVLHMAVAPPTEAFDGGVAAVRWAADSESFDIVLFDRLGVELPVRFEMNGLNGDPLYTPDDLPQNIIIRDGILLGDHGADCKVHRWDLDGHYIDFVTYPCGIHMSYPSVGFGLLGDLVVAGWFDGGIKAYDLAGNLRVQGPDFSGQMLHIRSGPDGDVAMIARGDFGANVMTFNRQGELVGSITTPVFGLMTRFMEGYLNLAESGQVQKRRRDLSRSGLWPRQAPAPRGALHVLLWLDDRL